MKVCTRSMLLALWPLLATLAGTGQAQAPAAGQAPAGAAPLAQPPLGAQPAAAQPGAQPASLYVLAPDKEGALEIGDGGLLKVPDGTGYVLSRNGRSVILNRGMLVAHSFALAGGASVSDQERVMVQERANTAGAGDPLADLPDPDWAKMQQFGPAEFGNRRAATNTLSPGVYDYLKVGFSQRVMLRPGTYVIKGNVDIGLGATVTGTNVTLCIGGKVSIGTGGFLSLVAPTDGPYKGVAWFSARGNNQGSWILDRGADIQGTIYMPDGTLDIWGGGKVTATNVVAGIVKVSGTLLIK